MAATSQPDHTTNNFITFGTTNLPEGVINLFRDTPRSRNPKNVSTAPQNDGTLLAILAVPPSMTPADFLTYIAPAEQGVAHIRLIRYVRGHCFCNYLLQRRIHFAETPQRTVLW